MKNELAVFWDGLKHLLSVAGDLILLNVLVFVGCIPVVTAGASWAAGYTCMLRLLRGSDAGFPFKPFVAAFRESFRAATPIWLLLLGCLGILAGDFYYAVYVSVPVQNFFLYFSVLMAVVLSLAATWVFPLVARYRNTLRGHIKNAFLLALASFPQTLLALAIQVLFITVPLVWTDAAIYFGWLWLLFGLSLPMYLTVKLYKKMLHVKTDPVDPTEESANAVDPQ